MRILLVDAHNILLAGVQALLATNEEIEVVGAVGSGDGALRLAAETGPDLVLLGMNLRDVDPVALIQRLLAIEPQMRVLVLAEPAERHLVTTALETGASGYVLKHATVSELMDAVNAVKRGQVYLDPAVTRLVLEADTSGDGESQDGPLTRREVDVLQRVVRGYTNRQIAADLGISPRTVESHRANLMAKLGLSSRVDLVSYAHQHGLLDADIATRIPL